MSQSDIDVDFLEGLSKIINSIEKSADSADSVLIKDGVDHWCPDVQEWHTADHEPADPPQVHINVAHAEGDDPYKSENMGDEGQELEKIGPLAAVLGGAALGAGGAVASRLLGGGEEKSVDVEKQSTVGNENIGGGSFGNKDENEGMVVMEDTEKEYDQNTNLPPEMGKRDEGESISEPFLRRRKISEIGDDIEKQGWTGREGASAGDPPPGDITVETGTPPTGVTGMSGAMAKEDVGRYDQPIDMLKIWASVDRELQKEDPNRIVDDLTILDSFDLDVDLTTDELVEGTLVHKMLTDRSIRPTKEWWEASMNLAKSVEGVSEPGILSAFLYYESDHFAMGDFIDISKLNEVEHTSRGKPQDLEMMPNSSGGDGMAGLGLSAEELHRQSFAGPKDEDCD